MSYNTQAMSSSRSPPKVQPCHYKTGKTLGAGSYSVVKECVHIDTGRYYAAKVINKRLMAGREHMVCRAPLALFSSSSANPARASRKAMTGG